MPRFRIFLCILLFGLAGHALAEQRVGSIAIDYPYPFQVDADTARDWLSEIPDEYRRLIVSMEYFVAAFHKGLESVSLTRAHYTSGFNASIDGAATESVQRIAALDGIKNLKQEIVSLPLGGFEARRVSIDADRWGGKVGGEFLLVYNPITNVLTNITMLFTKEKGANPFDDVVYDKERRYAKDVLSTVRLVPRFGGK